ncbi:MAG: stress response translation initiation inhibitor YciH [Candidatus Altiarchaeota archaeon]|nr:stress response translation initiation inhibitor YciH [Candidatus Altiarchaeota archaeon]
MADDFLKSAGLPEELWETIAKEKQNIVVRAVKRRWGKYVTIVEGFDKSVDAKKISKDLKQKLACGGTFKEGRIELQGDHRKHVGKLLETLGFSKESIDVK